MSTFTALRRLEPSPERNRCGKHGSRNASRCRRSRARPNDRMVKLRCKTPEVVRKEILAHLLGYKLLRTVMAVAADQERHRATAGETKRSHNGWKTKSSPHET